MVRARDTPLNDLNSWTAFFNKIHDAFLIVNVQTDCIVKANSLTDKLFGKTPKSLVGTHISSLFPPMHAPKIARQILNAKSPPNAQTPLSKAMRDCITSGENQELEQEITGGKWLRSRILPLEFSGKIKHLVIILTDITTQKRMEKVLQEYEQRY